ncbi:MAG: GEVED domain-containing protein [Bacteroidota bacterium]
MKNVNFLKFKAICFFVSFIALLSFQYMANAAVYCTPLTVTGCSSGNKISSFSLRGESGTIISNNSGPACSPVPSLAYSDFTNSGFDIPQLQPSRTYSGFLNTGTQNDYVTIWIDLNNDGTFADSERLLDNLNIGSSNLLYGIRIPNGAQFGQRRLRVRLIGSFTKPATLTDPCAAYDFGETEDYLVEIVNTNNPAIVAGGTSGACLNVAQMTINSASNNNGLAATYLVDSDNNYVAAIFAKSNNLGTVRPSLYINNPANPLRQDLGGRYYMDRNLTIAVETQPVGPYDLFYYYKDSELSRLIAQAGSGVSQPSNLATTKTGNDVCANMILDVVSIPNFFKYADNYLVVPGSMINDRYLIFYDLTSFSSFFLHGGSTALNGEDIGGPLPVNLLSFSVKKSEKLLNQIQWQVSNENKFAGYEIQKSENGNVFNKIGFISTSKSESYSYLDQNSAISNISYYRLKMIDTDGKSNFSRIIQIKNETDFDVNIFPNPVASILVIENANQDIFEIINSRGQLFKYQSITNSTNKKEILIGSLPSGQYFVKIGQFYKKFVKN